MSPRVKSTSRVLSVFKVPTPRGGPPTGCRSAAPISCAHLICINVSKGCRSILAGAFIGCAAVKQRRRNGRASARQGREKTSLKKKKRARCCGFILARPRALATFNHPAPRTCLRILPFGGVRVRGAFSRRRYVRHFYNLTASTYLLLFFFFLQRHHHRNEGTPRSPDTQLPGWAHPEASSGCLNAGWLLRVLRRPILELITWGVALCSAGNALTLVST